ncbi:MAG: hypothetical protein ACYDHD_00185 [Vulcanimicrobiaceae bacterium]
MFTHLRYLEHNGRHLLAGAVNTSSIDEVRFITEDDDPYHVPWLTIALTLSDLDPTNTLAAWGIAKEVAEDFLEGRPGYVVLHGPPQEPTNFHAHLVLRRDKVRSEDIAREFVHLRRKKDQISDRYGFSTSSYKGRAHYANLTRKDDFTFFDWCDSLGFSDLPDTCESNHELLATLNTFGVTYLQVDRGAVLQTQGPNGPITMKASALNLSPARLERQLGHIPDYHYDPRLTTRAYTNERANKYPEAVKEAHQEAIKAWQRTYHSAYKTTRKQALEAGSTLVKQAVSYLDILLAENGATIEDPTNRIWALHRMTQFLHQVRVGMARSATDVFPPKPAHRIYDWLTQLYVGNPEPIASADGVTLDHHALATWHHTYGTDLSLYDDGLRVARIADDRLYLLAETFPSRSLEDLPIIHADRVRLHHATKLDQAATQRALRADHAKRATPPAPPLELDALLRAELTERLARPMRAWEECAERTRQAFMHGGRDDRHVQPAPTVERPPDPSRGRSRRPPQPRRR